MRPKRLFLATLLACALAPGTWYRAPELPRGYERTAIVTPIPLRETSSGPFTLVEAWEMTGDKVHFGGLSALVALDNQRFLSGTDGGRKLVFERPDRSSRPGQFSMMAEGETAAKFGRDLESLAVDQASGTVWAGYEYRNAIVRLDDTLKPEQEVRPEAMEDWGSNSGPEALVRLADGRFLVLEERPSGGSGSRHNALVFSGDPIDTADPAAFRVRFPQGYRPVDAAALEEGRALILLRRVEWGFPPTFNTALAAVDVDAAKPGGVLPAQELTRFGTTIPQDNYEGLAITRDSDGTHVWMVSDDNFTALQRTLLLKLRWDQREKARE